MDRNNTQSSQTIKSELTRLSAPMLLPVHHTEPLPAPTARDRHPCAEMAFRRNSENTPTTKLLTLQNSRMINLEGKNVLQLEQLQASVRCTSSRDQSYLMN